MEVSTMFEKIKELLFGKYLEWDEYRDMIAKKEDDDWKQDMRKQRDFGS